MIILGLFEGLIFTDVNAFLTLMIFFAALLGAFSKSLLIAVYSGFMVFIHIVTQTDLSFFDNTGIAIVVIFVLYLSLRLIGFGLGSDEPTGG